MLQNTECPHCGWSISRTSDVASAASVECPSCGHVFNGDFRTLETSTEMSDSPEENPLGSKTDRGDSQTWEDLTKRLDLPEESRLGLETKSVIDDFIVNVFKKYNCADKIRVAIIVFAIFCAFWGYRHSQGSRISGVYEQIPTGGEGKLFSSLLGKDYTDSEANCRYDFRSDLTYYFIFLGKTSKGSYKIDQDTGIIKTDSGDSFKIENGDLIAIPSMGRFKKH